MLQFFTHEERGSERLSNLAEVAQLLMSETRVCLKPVSSDIRADSLGFSWATSLMLGK